MGCGAIVPMQRISPLLLRYPSRLAKSLLLRTANFACAIRSMTSVQIFHEKYSCFYFSEIMLLCRYPASSKRDVRVVTIRGVRGAVDAGCWRRTSADERGREIVWSWRPGADAKREDVDASSARRGQTSRSPRRARISVKTAAQGMPVDRLHLW
jgi:hypothetical protein